MSAPNPPQNYRVKVESGIKKLYFDVESGVSQSRVYLVELSGNILLGTTNTNNIVVSSSLTGPNDVEGQSEGHGTGWGVLNNPPISVDFGN